MVIPSLLKEVAVDSVTASIDYRNSDHANKLKVCDDLFLRTLEFRIGIELKQVCLRN